MLTVPLEDVRAHRLVEVGWTELQEKRHHLGSDHDRDLQDDEMTDINRIDDHRPQEIRAFYRLFLRSQLREGHPLYPEFAHHTHLATIHHALPTDQEEMVRLASNPHHEVLPRSVSCLTAQD